MWATKKLAFISCVVLAVIVASAQQYNVPFRPRAAAGGGGDILSEGFEGTGYEVTWTESGTGTLDEDETATCSGITSPGFEGSQCMEIVRAAGETGNTTQSFSAQTGNVYMRFFAKVTYTLAANSNHQSLAAIKDSGSPDAGVWLDIRRFGASYELSIRTASDTELAYKTAPASGESHCYEFMMNNTTNAWAWWVDESQTGMDAGSGTNAAIAVDPTHVWLSPTPTNIASSATLLIDRVDVSTTGPIGCD